jgi:DNA-binding MarR family transcriptional regulator
MLKYLFKIDKARSINKNYHVNDRQAFILDYICAQYLSHKVCDINNIILLKTAGSQATLHAVTKELAELNLIEVGIDPIDNRVKNVLPTPFSFTTFEDFSNFFSEIVLG